MRFKLNCASPLHPLFWCFVASTTVVSVSFLSATAQVNNDGKPWPGAEGVTG